MNLGLRATFLVEHLDLPLATGDDSAAWEAYQLLMLSDEGQLSVYRKARQIGWSFTAACDAVADATVNPGATSIFVSINREEATEKIRYAKAVIAALDDGVRPTVINDNQSALELENKSRIMSHPSKAIRGRTKARVYLDEFAHYAKDRIIYQSALPVTTRGGFIRIGSTPMGSVGVFHDVVAEASRKYPGYRRFNIPWWAVRSTCSNPGVATGQAPTLPTADRVRLFGTQRLITIFENMLLEDFRQEYECDWSDEMVVFIGWPEIQAAQSRAQSDGLRTWHARSSGEAANMLLEMAADDKLEKVFYAGMDVGRRKDLTEIVLLGRTTSDQLVHRLSISLANVPFDEQEQVAASLFAHLPIAKLCVDETGIGMQLAEKLKFRFGTRVEPITFTAGGKELMATEVKMRMQKAQLLLSADRELAMQIHSIKRLVTPAKNVTFDVERSEKHHADKFWALALACLAAHGPIRSHFR